MAVWALLSSLGVSSAQSASNAPVRLVVTADHPTITASGSVNITIQLYGPKQPARAPKDYSASVEALDNGSAFWKRSVPIRKGTDSAQVAIQIDRVGVFMIRASNPELREGAIWVNVRRKGSTEARNTGGYRLVAVGWQAPQDSGVEVTIRATGTSFSADGNDAALIQAFVTKGHPRSDITLKFLPSLGELRPNPLVLHASDGQAEGHLTSNQRGSATLAPVNVEAADNVAIADNEWQTPVRFLQPIKTARVQPLHPQLSLIDPPEDVYVELVGPDGKPVTPDEDITVTLAGNDGGDITPSSITLTAQAPQKPVQFAPRHPGHATIVATPFAAAQSDPAMIDVFVPWTALLGVILGGFFGGLGALLGQKLKGWKPALMRGLLGILAALILYWAIETGLSHIPATVVGNTLYAVLGSLFAGYLGTKAIDFVWDRIGKLAA
jgi:hypothetical protein